MLPVIACRKVSTPTEPNLPAPHAVSDAMPVLDSSRKALAIHSAAQECALDGFQFGKSHLGWPYEVRANSVAGYFQTLIREGFLSYETVERVNLGWRISNLSDADPGETAFLRLDQPDKTALIVRKDGQWAVFRDEMSAAAFAKTPPREPFWLP
jgi:hypothetical protein